MRLILPLVLSLCALPAWAAKHAFVLANNAYEQLDDLRNTHANAAAYGGAFEELGFDVTHHRDLTRAETLGAFDAFLSRVRPGDQVAFVYSGHGWSDGQGNYLVPTDAPRQGSDRRLRGQSLALRNGVNGVLDEIEALGAGLTVAVIDACRDNPFKPPEGRKSVGLSRGLARVSAPEGTFVIFSAGEGQQALDRLPDDPADQRLSVFSRVFVPNLTSGVTLEDAISTTQAEVASLALGFDGHRQHPAYYDQTLGKTCLKGDCAPQTVAVRPGPSACDRQYEKAEELDACFAYEAYAESCPDTCSTLSRRATSPATAPRRYWENEQRSAPDGSPRRRRDPSQGGGARQRAVPGQLLGNRGADAIRSRGHWVWRAAFSPDGTRIVTASGDRSRPRGSGRPRGGANWPDSPVTGAKCRARRSRPTAPGSSPPPADDTARVWDAATGRELATLSGHGDGLWSAAFSPDGTRIVTASSDKTSRVWGGE